MTSDRASRLAEIEAFAQEARAVSVSDGLWLLSDVRASDIRLKEMVGLLREAEAKLSAHAVRIVWADNFPNGCKCAICDASSADARISPRHTPDCTITRLRNAADQADHKEPTS